MFHRLFINCGLEIEDNSIQIKKDLETFIYQLRLRAEVAVVEMVFNFTTIHFTSELIY